MSDDAPKIIIDEGWKAQVQREKEEAEKKAAQSAPASAPSAEAADPHADGADGGPHEMDEGNFTALVGSLATQIMYALGLIADPQGGQVMVNLDAARYTLDILAVLEEKTQGNLTAEEGELLAQSRAELEQVFALRVQQFEEQAMQQAGIDPNGLKGQ